MKSHQYAMAMAAGAVAAVNAAGYTSSLAAGGLCFAACVLVLTVVDAVCDVLKARH